MTGAAAGSKRWGGFWKWDREGKQGVWQPLKPLGGEFRAAGLLIVRTAWEITRKEVDNEGTIYSRTDSLITLGEGTGAWKAAGLTVKEVKSFSGPQHIVCLGCYRAGQHKTEPYKDRETQMKCTRILPGQVARSASVERRPPPKINYSRWLTG